jgi:hypothetical protein
MALRSPSTSLVVTVVVVSFFGFVWDFDLRIPDLAARTGPAAPLLPPSKLRLSYRASFSFILALTSFLTSAAGNGLSGRNRMVPLLVS